MVPPKRKDPRAELEGTRPEPLLAASPVLEHLPAPTKLRIDFRAR